MDSFHKQIGGFLKFHYELEQLSVFGEKVLDTGTGVIGFVFETYLQFIAFETDRQKLRGNISHYECSIVMNSSIQDVPEGEYQRTVMGLTNVLMGNHYLTI